MQTYFRLKNLTSKQIHTVKQPHMVLGRNTFSDIHIDSGLLSRQHAEIRREGDRIVIEDLSSTNGTFVNNMRIERPTELMHGDVVTVGHEKLMVIAPDKNDGSTVFTYNMSQESEPASEEEQDAGRTQLQKAFPSPLGWTSIQTEANDDEEVNQKILQQALGQQQYDAHETPAVLVVRKGQNQGQVYNFVTKERDRGQWAIGRNKLVDVIIDHPTVSNQHALVRWEDEKWVIADSQSTNGLKINHKRVESAPCESGDVVSLGNLELIFKVL